MRIRKLTPLETERLQGWSLKQGFENHTKLGLFEDGQTKEISNSQRYKMCGNGISSPVSKHTLESFINEPVRVLSLFSGVGGTELLLDASRFKLVGNCENDKYAQAVLRLHHPELPHPGRDRITRDARRREWGRLQPRHARRRGRPHPGLR